MSRRPRPRAPAAVPSSAARSGAVRASNRPRIAVPTHHALARHRPTRGLWVFELRGETLVGVCGPLDGDPPPVWLLPHFDFESADARASLPIVRAHLDEFERLA